MVAPMLVLGFLACTVALGGQTERGQLWQTVDRHEYLPDSVGPPAATDTRVMTYLQQSRRKPSHDHTAATLGLIAAFAGLLVAWLFFARGALSSRKLAGQFPRITAWLQSGGRFDETYEAIAVAPAVRTGRGLTLVDHRLLDGLVHGLASRVVALARWDDRFDRRVVDHAVNGVGRLAEYSGGRLRLLQTGSVRQYVLLLGAGLLSVFAVVFTFLAA